MLSGIASYLFGGSNETQENETSPGEQPAQQPADRSRPDSPTRLGCNLKISAAEEEWLLVDKTSRPCSQEGPRRGLTARLEGATTYEGLTCRSKGQGGHPTTPTSPPGGDVMSRSASDSNSDVSTLPDNMSTDESWLVTPPPCFTARLSTTASMEVGSMENLLIEHPSMSVYGARGRQGSSGVESDRESMSDIEEAPSGTTPRPDHRVEAHRPTRRSGRALALRDTQSPEKVATKAATVAQRKNNRHYNRSQLKMQNKLANLRNNNKSQRQHLHQPSNRQINTPTRY